MPIKVNIDDILLVLNKYQGEAITYCSKVKCELLSIARAAN